MSPTPSALRRRAVTLLAALLVGCGGGGGGSPDPIVVPFDPGPTGHDDFTAYSTARDASLAAADEGSASAAKTVTVGGTTLAYTMRAGHLIARDLASGQAEASMFYVAYTADGAAAASRPVTFLYNGGPGSASVWLHLGSFAPKRLATGVPSTAAATPFALVDNAETLLDTTDLVFVDAVGTGWSEAIAPYTNGSFWGVDSDAAVFRDFVVRWLAAYGRVASALFLYGESYGGPRTAVLARRLAEAGVPIAGLVLQSPALDYNSNCGVTGQGSCANNLPSYAAAGAWFGKAGAALPDLDAWMASMRTAADSRYAPAVAAYLGGTPPATDLPAALEGWTGIGAALWRSQFNLGVGTFQRNLLPGQITGLYDARMAAADGSALAADGDPSSTFITPSFAATIAGYLRDSVRFNNRSTYVLLSNAITTWDFGHAGRGLPDTVPDLAAALALLPDLRVLAVGGYHDLATPFHVTETDLARLGGDARVQQRFYPGGHMSYLDDATRVRQKADLAAWYRQTLAAQPARAARTLPLALRARPAADRVGTPPTAPQPVVPEPALQQPLRDPWVPPRLQRQ